MLDIIAQIVGILCVIVSFVEFDKGNKLNGIYLLVFAVLLFQAVN